MRDQTITEFLDQLAARVPAPGGGATAALHAAQAAALLAMVARYSDGAKYDAAVMEHVITEADELRSDALTLAEMDAAAFSAVTDAYALPKGTEEEKQARSAAIAEALGGAARPPADVVRISLLLVALAEELLPTGNKNVITDVAAAAEAARAATVTALVNIEVNLRGIADETVRATSRPWPWWPRRSPPAPTGSWPRCARRSARSPAYDVAVRARAGGGHPGRDRSRGGGTGRHRAPARLTVVAATDDEATAWYVRSIASAAAKAGIGCEVEDLGPQATAAGIEAQLRALSQDPTVDGIILQTPLPGGARLAELAAAIDPAKDVDGANPVSLGRLMTGLPTFAPATAEAVLRLLDHHQVPLEGRRAVVVGRSAVVGKPVAHLLLDRNATVTICHSRTRDLAAVTAEAEVLVVAAGRIGMIGPDYVAPGATVIDVGTNATPDGGLAGDVDPKVADVAGGLTPVPGGVGPVTTALLLRHVTDAATAARR